MIEDRERDKMQEREREIQYPIMFHISREGRKRDKERERGREGQGGERT